MFKSLDLAKPRWKMSLCCTVTEVSKVTVLPCSYWELNLKHDQKFIKNLSLIVKGFLQCF